ncbi:Hypothetical predicted protein [Podarcis lilfordi]|uniref:Uncharacterized protein n=1 Tax=Podarcis lilfordi TaxID=74358 RepID=A0AA35K2X9_9SAUR|nr:Hypothetical predicted protein [Podarcis lilfordi]
MESWRAGCIFEDVKEPGLILLKINSCQDNLQLQRTVDLSYQVRMSPPPLKVIVKFLSQRKKAVNCIFNLLFVDFGVLRSSKNVMEASQSSREANFCEA